MAGTGRIGSLPIDPVRVTADLSVLDGGFAESYEEFVCGSWQTCMLWNATGDSRHHEIADYGGAAHPTEFGRAASYLNGVVSEHFDVDRLRFARVTRLAAGSVVVPHRDYLELDSEFVRIHVPLQTDPNALASDGDTIYHMNRGDVWFLDATGVHSIANFSDLPRVHLLLDFLAPSPVSVFRGPPVPPQIPEDSLRRRRETSGHLAELLGPLRGILDENNLMDVAAILVKRFFTTEIPVDDVFGGLRLIAESSGRSELVEAVADLQARAVIAR